MRVAILSDVHGNAAALERVLADARARGAEHFYNLGDTGNGQTHALLAAVKPKSVIGNWEVSSWQTLPSPWREEVRTWPFIRQEEGTFFCHASPVWPDEVQTLEDAARYVQTHGSWFALFPALDKDEEARWEAFAHMAQVGAWVTFHGHTHVQAAWVLTPDNHMRRLSGDVVTLQPQHLYIIGVGSVGRPLDGPGTCYALWDREEQTVRLIR
ncbi:MAG: metallophosphoesterase family protein [Chloroflexi bacterium]|nr:metallophosphoesterase family protein [Chloroflexota bacterium]